jgi:hypothetical protein
MIIVFKLLPDFKTKFKCGTFDNLFQKENITTMYSLFIYIFAFWQNFAQKSNLIQHVWFEMFRDFKFENIIKLAYKYF